MGPRQFLVHGLLAGLFAGIAAFAVAYTIGEPPVDAAIAVEEAAAPAVAEHSHGDDAGHDDAAGHTHSHGDEGTTFSRQTQSTWGLATATIAVGTALGGLTGLVTAAAVGRIGRLRATQSAAVVAAVAFVAVALVPFLKYPATPPAVGDPGTIGDRTGLYFGFQALSVLAAVAAVILVARLLSGLGAYRAVLVSVGAYLLVVGVAAALMPAVDEIGAFPASTLWEFRLGSLLTLTALWAGIGIALVGLVGRAQEKAALDNARRALAASL